MQGIKVTPSDFRVQPIVERCIHLLNQQAAQKRVKLIAELPDSLKLHADANHFEFIIRNLLSNAIKFSHEGGTNHHRWKAPITPGSCLIGQR